MKIQSSSFSEKIKSELLARLKIRNRSSTVGQLAILVPWVTALWAHELGLTRMDHFIDAWVCNSMGDSSACSLLLPGLVTRQGEEAPQPWLSNRVPSVCSPS